MPNKTPKASSGVKASSDKKKRKRRKGKRKSDLKIKKTISPKQLLALRKLWLANRKK